MTVNLFTGFNKPDSAPRVRSDNHSARITLHRITVDRAEGAQEPRNFIESQQTNPRSGQGLTETQIVDRLSAGRYVIESIPLDWNSWSASKALGQPAGQFLVGLKPYGPVEDLRVFTTVGPEGIPMYGLVDSGDWIEINTYRGGQLFQCMIGRVDRVQVNTTADPKTDVTLSGRDIGSIFVDHPLYINPWDILHSNAAGVTMMEILKDAGGVSGRADQLVSFFLVGILGSNRVGFGVLPLAVGDPIFRGPHFDNEEFDQESLSAFGLLSTRRRQMVDFSRIIDTRLYVKETTGIQHIPQVINTSNATPLWNFAQQFLDGDFNEVFLDTRFDEPEASSVHNDQDPKNPYLRSEADSFLPQFGRKAYLHIRQRPFVDVVDGTDSDWFKLHPAQVALSDISSLRLSKGANRINYVLFIPQLPVANPALELALTPPAIDIASIERFGLSRLEVRSPFILDLAGEDEGLQLVHDQRARLVSWNILNPYYWQGVITVEGIRPDIRIGTKIALVDGPIPWLPEGSNSAGTLQGDGNAAVTGKLSSLIPESLNEIDPKRLNGLTFYVEAVQWGDPSQENPQPTTQLQVSRGFFDSLRLPYIQKAFRYWTTVEGRPLADFLTDSEFLVPSGLPGGEFIPVA